ERLPEEEPGKIGSRDGQGKDGRFLPGNRLGRGVAPGSRHKVTIALEALLEGEAEGLTRKAVEMAMAGDVVALRLCLDRIFPPRKGRSVAVKLPTIETAAYVLAAHSAVTAAMGEGELTPDEAQVIANVLEQKRRAIETLEIEKRVAALEE